MTAEQRAAISDRVCRSRREQGLPEQLTPEEIDRVRTVFAAAALADSNRSTRRAGGATSNPARRQALLHGLADEPVTGVP